MTDTDSLPPAPPPLPEAPPRKAWGFGATLALGLLATGAMVMVQSLVFGVFAGIMIAQARTATGEPPPFDAMISQLLSHPLALSASVLFSVPITVGVIWLAITLRRGLPFREYLGLRRFGVVQFFVWAIALAAVLLGGERLLIWTGDNSGELFMRELLARGEFVVPLFAAVILAAPLGEELLFRGFMFRGIAESRAGWWTAILVPNLFWVGLHVQYSFPTLLVLFAMGIVLGLARRFSGSVTLPIVLHVLSNAVSAVTALTMEAPPSSE